MGLVDSSLKLVSQLTAAGWKRMLPLAGAAIAGVGASVWAGVNWARASRDVDEALRQNQAARNLYETVRANTDRAVDEYAELMSSALSNTVERFANWLELNEVALDLTACSDQVAIEELPSTELFARLSHEYSTGAGVLGAIVGAVGSGRAGVLWGVQTFATASTGTPISDHRGVAATNAIMAWLGGGAKAAGGGGMAAGDPVLQLASLLPRILIFGAAASLGSVASSERARRTVENLDEERDRIGVIIHSLGVIQQRVVALRALLTSRDSEARVALEHLVNLDYEPGRHDAELMAARNAVDLVVVTLNTPVVDA